MADVTDAKTSTKQLEHVAENAKDVLMQANTVVPFTLFPTTITIDRVKVTITKRPFINVAKTTSILIDDILNVEANTGPWLGSIKFWSRYFPDKPHEPLAVVNWIKNNQALAIKRLLQGFIIARQKEIDCSQIEKGELIKLLHKLGSESGAAAS